MSTARIKPSLILFCGWCAILVYAYPGYMSFDSFFQLEEARTGLYGDGHPPAMAAMWRLFDRVIAGPFPMLVLQLTTFLVGTYLVLERFMSARWAALLASCVLLFPPVAVVMAVVWKDSQMAGFLMLGAGLLLSPSRRSRVAGLGVLALATAMRHNALAMTFPLVLLLFWWSSGHRWWQRYPVAIAAWLAITFSAQTVNRALTTHEWHIWHQSLALLDITGTLRYADPLPDHELAPVFAGTPLQWHDNIQAWAAAEYPAHYGRTDGLWFVTWHQWSKPTTTAERTAIAQAWRHVVFGNPAAYLTYRWQIFKDVLAQPFGAAAYIWFVDVTEPQFSAERSGHIALPGKIQAKLRQRALWISSTWLFRIRMWALLALVLVPFALRDRRTAAILGSGIANETVLFLITPSPDHRYSYWLIVATLMTIILLIAKRAGATPAQSHPVRERHGHEAELAVAGQHPVRAAV